MLKKEIIVLGDIEMGAGNLTDDFISDQALVELIDEIAQRSYSVDLILNGDTFDFLKCPYFKKNRLVYPRHITAEISLKKLKLIHSAHWRVFGALKRFIQNKKHTLFFIIGNHDPDLVYKKVQKQIKRLLEAQANIHFLSVYRNGGVYVEHGHQYDFLNKLNFDKLFLNYKKSSILNLSFVSLGLISHFMSLKEDHPFLERIFPRPTLFSIYKPITKKVTLETTSYFLKSILYYPFRFYSDPTYTFPKELFREFYRRMRKLHFDVDGIISTFIKSRLSKLKKTKIHVLSHVHEKYIEDKGGQVIIHPGSWRDEYNLNPKTKKLTPRKKHYLQILMAENDLEYQLIHFPVKRTTLDLNEVIADEVKFIKKAAKEENFNLTLV